MLKILYISTGLDTGGAERMLYNLLSKINRDRFSPVVLSLMDRGTWGPRIEALEIPVYTSGMKPGKPTLAAIWQCIAQSRQIQPDLIQGWMYHGNLAAQVASTLNFRSVPVLWNIRQSLHSLNDEKQGTSVIIQLMGKVSNLPKKILYNSKTSAIQHEKTGYPKNKSVVIPNGFDPEVFTPSIESYISVRRELDLPGDAFLIGRIGRYHPMKDYENFLQGAALLMKIHPEVQFVLAGTEVDRNNQILCKLIDDLKIAGRIHLLGERHDIPRLTAALDIAASSSSCSEGFPNVVGEAMSCGVPCVVTDIGDSAWVVGNTGYVVPPRDPETLAIAWKELINLGSDGREVLGKAARARIIEHFSLDSVVAQYEKLYENVLLRKAKSKI